ncbi:winged helix-turn-helix domain-containing protein [Sphingobacterium sp. NGMCC 1.201703]|uniref:winged helix-turn-helix domain-containing protein n=1 Tax=Sphingobacterium sp. NGMCC 1.201703 TaxID=3388657 RepID=UPI0039FC2E12
MLDRKKTSKISSRYIYGSLLLLFTGIIFVSFSSTDTEDFDFAKREVLLRSIGHQLLLQSGDSTSRVLPIEKVAKNEYQIKFEHELDFQPEALVNTVRSLLAKDPLAVDYIVDVLNCSRSNVVYGFAISKNKKDDIIACQGRTQPRACYIVNIKFKPIGIDTIKNKYLFGSLPILAVVGFIFMRSVKSRKNLPIPQLMALFTLGTTEFDVTERKLTINGTTIDLTATESRLMLIFASTPNEMITRSRLQKELWEDEGVIVGRSLDMFISKLRKKLEADPKINIVVIRGKGYKLEVGT